jgi:hypothetical protein
MMESSLELRSAALPMSANPSRLPAIPWRDPHTVSPERLSQYIRTLEAEYGEIPESADVCTCLGMAHAMNFDVYRSLDCFEAAVRADPTHFFAQLKYAELLYRIRTLRRAEQETLRALELANNGWELSLARVQLKEIRALVQKGNERPTRIVRSSRLGFLGATAVFLFALGLLLR